MWVKNEAANPTPFSRGREPWKLDEHGNRIPEPGSRVARDREMAIAEAAFGGRGDFRRDADAGHRGGPVRIGRSSEDRQGMNEKDGHP